MTAPRLIRAKPSHSVAVNLTLVLQCAALAALTLACRGKSAVEAPPGNWQGRCGTPADRSAALSARYPDGPPGAPQRQARSSSLMPVVDQAAIFQDATKASLAQELDAYHRETCHQFIVITVTGLQGMSIDDYSLSLAKAWRIGHERLNNGLMLLVAPKDRKARIEVGCGLEDVISDDYAAQLMRDVLVPAFRQVDYERGVREGMKALMDRARSKKVPPGFIQGCGGDASTLTSPTRAQALAFGPPVR